MQDDSNREYQAVIDSPIPGVACLGIAVTADGVEHIDLFSQHQPCYVEEEARDAAEAVLAYLHHARFPEPLSLAPHGTPFQQRVWRALQGIPPGEVSRYGELASSLDSSPRAVASACRANPIPLLIPCHRVVAANGPGGYMGETQGDALAIKWWLLQHEGYV